MDAKTPCWLVVNPASGSNTADSAESIKTALEQRGWEVARTLVFPDDGLPDPRELRAQGIAQLVIYTGDGSMGTLINHLSGWSGSVLALPGGTMNLLPLRLHRTLDIEAILDVVAGGGAVARRLGCVRCDAGLALAGLLVGPGTAWSRVRESMRHFAVAEIASETIAAIRETATGPYVTLPERTVARAEGYPLVELTPGEHGIQIDGYFAEAPGDFAEQAWALLRRRFREGPHDRLGLADAITLQSIDGGPLACLIDGEPAECPSPFRFTLEYCGVDLLATAHDC